MPAPGQVIKPDRAIDPASPDEQLAGGAFHIPPRDLEAMIEIINQGINMYCLTKGVETPQDDRGPGYLSYTFDNGASFTLSIEQEEEPTSTGKTLEPTAKISMRRESPTRTVKRAGN